MTNPDDRTGPAEQFQGKPEETKSAPSWIDEVLDASSVTATPPAATTLPVAPAPAPSAPLSGPGDLKIPPLPGEVRAQGRLTPPPPPHRTSASASADDRTDASADTSADDWVAQATRGAAKSPSVPGGPVRGRHPSGEARPYADPADTVPDPWAEAGPVHDRFQVPSPQPMRAWGEGSAPGGLSGESVAQKKLIAGLLAIFLGGLGVHKFYLNMNTPGLVMLATNLGVWVLALVLGLLLFVVGVFVTMPLAGLVSTALGIVGLIEGVIYLTKSDADFQRDYLIGKKPWF